MHLLGIRYIYVLTLLLIWHMLSGTKQVHYGDGYKEAVKYRGIS